MNEGIFLWVRFVMPYLDSYHVTSVSIPDAL